MLKSLNKIVSRVKKMSFLKGLSLVIVLSVFWTSCHEDFAPVGNEVIGDPNFEFKLFDTSTIKAYSRKASPVQTNSLGTYQLGVYNDPVYGLTQASFLAQLTLEETQPSFGINPKIETVYIEIPYFSTETTVDEISTYVLDSVFGSEGFTISFYESKYFLRDLDPDTGFEEPQKYYSNQGALFESFLGETLREPLLFIPHNQEVVVEPIDPDGEVETLTPRLRLPLDTLFFRQKILDYEGKPELVSQQNFKDHLRGIYIKAEPVDYNGTLFLFNPNQAVIRISYSYDDEEGARKYTEFKLNLNGISVNTFENQFPAYIESRLANPNTEIGEENLFLKGGAGTMTVIELFGEDANNNGVPDELEILRANNWIINEANIILNVNQDIVEGGQSEPERIFLYDIKNKVYLRDYTLDNAVSESDILNYKSSHLGRLSRDGNGHGKSYKLRITDYVNDLITKDSTNVVLGLVTSQNVGILTYQSLQNEVAPGFEETLTGSVLCPEGTVLYGNTGNESTKIKMNIYYTELIQ